MKTLFTTIFVVMPCISSGQNQKFVTDDIEHFWKAYEKIKTTNDTAKQYQYLRDGYVDRGTPGLKSLIQVRDYTNKEYIDAIQNYPNFWQSLKTKTQRIEKLYPEIEADIDKL